MRRGVAGVFADSGGTWQAAGPTLPAGFGGDQVQVLGLARTSGGDAALLLAGTGPAGGVVGRDALDGVGPGPGGRGHRGVGVRAGRERLGAARRRPGGDHHRVGGIVADAAARAEGNGARARDGGFAPGAGAGYDALAVSGSLAHRLAAGRDGLDQGPGDRGTDRVRFLELGGTAHDRDGDVRIGYYMPPSFLDPGMNARASL